MHSQKHQSPPLERFPCVCHLCLRLYLVYSLLVLIILSWCCQFHKTLLCRVICPPICFSDRCRLLLTTKAFRRSHCFPIAALFRARGTIEGISSTLCVQCHYTTEQLFLKAKAYLEAKGKEKKFTASLRSVSRLLSGFYFCGIELCPLPEKVLSKQT